MDEATASVDAATDRRIQAVLEHEFSQSTVITIAHRFVYLSVVYVSDEWDRIETIIGSNLIVLMSAGTSFVLSLPSVVH